MRCLNPISNEILKFGFISTIAREYSNLNTRDFRPLMKICPNCLKSKGSVSVRQIYKCKKCGQIGCWAAGREGDLMEAESCLPTKCRMGGEHDKIYIGTIEE